MNTGGEGFILDEQQRTNLSLYSNQFNNSYWSKRAGLTITDNFSISPDGTNNASKCALTSGDGYLFRTFNFNPSTTYTISVFAKIAGSFQFNIFSGSNSFINTVTTTNEFQRFSFTFTTGATVSAGDFGIKVFNNLEIFGFQLEIGNTVSSYVPTVASATTRNADVITVAPPTGTVKITTTFSDNTTQVLTTIPATYTMPEGLIKSVNFNNTL